MRKFTPKLVPRRRGGDTERLQEEQKIKNEFLEDVKPTWRQRRPKHELPLTASGPFAMGPAAAPAARGPAVGGIAQSGWQASAEDDALAKLISSKKGSSEDKDEENCVNLEKLKELTDDAELLGATTSANFMVPVVSDRVVIEVDDTEKNKTEEVSEEAQMKSLEKVEEERIFLDLQTLAQDFKIDGQETGETEEGHALLLQFPDILPEFEGGADLNPAWPGEQLSDDMESDIPLSKQSKNKTSDGLDALPDIPSCPPAGQVGTMYVHESGKTVLEIAGTRLLVQPGSECAFLQELMAINPESKRVWNLGTIRKRLLVSPDF
ncbi:DNA-directed RNA polymerase III complex subunit Rpc53 [Schizosaccharomyces japonicus yFS275]|uniref:DNA-directed RNA polymerase III complex subunit Rpc53 n=1 Tax=Schizosaccharomyces japonicus (strain yFS275 / FY16936) TaxID=402676 RepID=B6K6S0_SCHJY|nr:DNA-directed RNA polymerase III complex subunit Rpc53 [Schizosaccharomyces japonicus yFS275]EEB09224.1 DNA-directed RNA polymerase III complex subunit Rpc53 [Schizosaccharomyces japonicus yFS275]